MKLFTGAITALVTPFEQNGVIDTNSLRELIALQLDGGINGIVPCGSTGEAATLSDEEYQLVIKTVVEEVNGRIPVIAGAGSNNTQKAIRLSQLAQQAGADGLLHVTPYYNKPSPSGILAHFQAIAEAVDLPIILYNVPGRTGQNCSADTTLHLAENMSQIVGIKEASGDINQIMNIIQSAHADFTVLSGDDTLTLPVIAAGGDGCISVVSNQIPQQFSQLVALARSGDMDSARKLHYQFLDLMNVNFIESNPVPVKTSLAMMGTLEEVFRLPLVGLTNANKQTIKSTLQKVELL